MNRWPALHRDPRRLAPILMLAALLSACALPRAREGEMRVFTLQPELPRHAQAVGAGPELRVAPPEAGAPLDGDRVAIRVGDSEYGVLRGLRWSEPAPRLWQGVLVRAFEDDGRIRAGRDREGLAAHHGLLGELRAFEYHREDASVRIVYAARLVDRGQHLRAQRVFRAEHRVAGTDGAEVVAAFRAASRDVAAEVIDWVMEETAR